MAVSHNEQTITDKSDPQLLSVTTRKIILKIKQEVATDIKDCCLDDPPIFGGQVVTLA